MNGKVPTILSDMMISLLPEHPVSHTIPDLLV